MATETTEPNFTPVTVALRELFDEHHATLRAVAARTRELDETGKGISYPYISGVLSGRETPSTRSLELLARAFDVDPGYFLEYRLRQRQAELEPRLVGIAAAAKRLKELESAELGSRRFAPHPR